MSVVTETFWDGDRMNFNFDPDIMDADDLETGSLLLPFSAVKLFALPGGDVLGVPRELHIAYWIAH